MGTPHTSLREWGFPHPFGSVLEPNAVSGSDLLDIVAIWSLLPAVEHEVDLVDVGSVDVLARLVATLLTLGPLQRKAYEDPDFPNNAACCA